MHVHPTKIWGPSQPSKCCVSKFSTSNVLRETGGYIYSHVSNKLFLRPTPSWDHDYDVLGAQSLVL